MRCQLHNLEILKLKFATRLLEGSSPEFSNAVTCSLFSRGIWLTLVHDPTVNIVTPGIDFIFDTEEQIATVDSTYFGNLYRRSQITGINFGH